jgi:hypothetical protein
MKHKHSWTKTGKCRYSDPLQYEYKCACGKNKWKGDPMSGIETLKLTEKEFYERYYKFPNTKSALLVFIFFIFNLFAFGKDTTNGVFYIDTPIECHLISQNGSIVTNNLVGGKTYMVANVIIEMSLTNKTTFFFSGGIIVDVAPKSDIAINLFEQEVKNLDAQPRRAEFGSHNLSLEFGVGEFSVVYPNITSNSTFTITTPYTSYELHGGKYFFRISDKSAIVYVLEGTMNVHGDKRIDKTEKGKLAVAIPFSDPGSGIKDKIVNSIKTLQQDEIDRFAAPILDSEKRISDVQFFVIGGRVIGIWMEQPMQLK